MLLFRIIIFICLILTIISCDKSFEPIGEGTPIDESIVADGFGDHNGTASKSEIEFIRNFFSTHQQIWAIGSIAGEYEDDDDQTIPSEIIVDTFRRNSPLGPYSSENEIRQEFDGVSFRTLHVGVYVLSRNSKYFVIRFFRAPGAGISDREWDELQIL